MKNLYQALQSITETFKDAVPIDHKQLPVIRYTQVNETPSLFGDDKSHEWAGYYQVDLYDNGDNVPMKEAIKEICEENFWRITNIQETEEENKKRYIFELKIEE